MKLCSIVALFCLCLFQSTAEALTLKEFVNLQKREQILYLYGVLDVAVIEATPLGRGECAEKWGGNQCL